MKEKAKRLIDLEAQILAIREQINQLEIHKRNLQEEFDDLETDLGECLDDTIAVIPIGERAVVVTRHPDDDDAGIQAYTEVEIVDMIT